MLSICNPNLVALTQARQARHGPCVKLDSPAKLLRPANQKPWIFHGLEHTEKLYEKCCTDVAIGIPQSFVQITKLLSLFCVKPYEGYSKC